MSAVASFAAFSILALAPAVASRQDLPRPPLAAATSPEASIAFPPSAAARARARLDAGLADPKARTLALMALGSSGASAEAPFLASLASAGKLLERRAACLSLGELGPAAAPWLAEVARGDVTGIEEALVVAALRTGDSAARAQVERWAEQGATGALAQAARALLSWARGGELPLGCFAFDLLCELRRGAAKEYGTQGGRRYRSVLLEGLARDRAFLDPFIIAAAADLEQSALSDHIAEILRAGGPPERLRGAVLVLAPELERWIAEGRFTPANAAEWRALLDEIQERRLERSCVGLLEQAFRVPEVARQAGALLLRAGATLPRGWLARVLEESGPHPRALLLEAIADRGGADRGGADRGGADRGEVELRRLASRFLGSGEALEVRASALVTLARLADEKARKELLRILTGAPSTLATGIHLVLARSCHDPFVLEPVLGALARTDLEPEARFRLEIGVGLRGRLEVRDSLRAWLALGEPHPLRALVVRALAARGDARDGAVLAELFPVEGDRELNLELARSLLARRDASAMGLLMGEVWHGPFDQAMLAAGVLVKSQGLSVLVDELAHPPGASSREDLRRVGFALGAWGGLEAVELLERRASQSDAGLQGAYLGALVARAR